MRSVTCCASASPTAGNAPSRNVTLPARSKSASNHGAPAEVVEEGQTGLRFRPGDGADLAAKVRAALSDRTRLAQMRRQARHEFEAKYTGERNHEMLISIYEKARAGHPSQVEKPKPEPKPVVVA